MFGKIENLQIFESDEPSRMPGLTSVNLLRNIKALDGQLRLLGQYIVKKNPQVHDLKLNCLDTIVLLEFHTSEFIRVNCMPDETFCEHYNSVVDLANLVFQKYDEIYW
jgi:hypothetical protein